MKTREKISIILLCLGLILAFLPVSGSRSLILKPQKLLPDILDESTFVSVDQVARYVNTEDSTVQIIDLRTPEEFKSCNIPGAVNIPYSEILQKDPGYFLERKNVKTIFYSNGDIDASYALTIARGLKYENTYVMKGGLNEWFEIVMNSSFTGERISARENALYESRTRAKKLFTELNSLPDSLKMKYFEAKHIAARKLDGGCE